VNIDNEIWIKSDWLSMPLEGNFDVVFGDMVLRMIEKERQEEFLEKIKNSLSSDGIFVMREHFIDESLFELPGEEILSKSINISDEGLAANAISGRVLDKFSDLTPSVINRRKAIEFMQEAVGAVKNSREKAIFSKALKIILGGIEWKMFDKLGWAANSKIQIENLIGKFFNITDVKTAGDYPDSKFYPVYFLKNK
jgi:predicted CopG family antitoxin